MGIGLAIGIACDFGGLIGQGDGVFGGGGTGGGTSDGGGGGIASGFADSIGGTIDRRGFIQVPWRNIPRALKILSGGTLMLPLMAHAAETAERSLGSRFALYIGPVITFAMFYVTIGGCFGGFNCFAGGGGLKFGSFGIGVLFPIGK